MSTHAPVRAPLANTTPMARHNRTRWLLIGTIVAIAVLAAIVIVAARHGHGDVLSNATADGNATVAAAPKTDIIATLPPGVPVFRLVRTAYDIDGRAVEVCDTIMSAEAYVLNYELPAH